MSFLSFLYDHNAATNSINVSSPKYNNLFGCSQNHILFIKQFLNPFTKNVTGLTIKNFLKTGFAILSAFHKIPDNQNIAVINDLTKFTKSLLIAPINEENNPHNVKNINESNIQNGNCNIYMSGANPKNAKITPTINNSIKFTDKLDKLTNVGIVDTGNFIFVTK